MLPTIGFQLRRGGWRLPDMCAGTGSLDAWGQPAARNRYRWLCLYCGPWRLQLDVDW